MKKVLLILIIVSLIVGVAAMVGCGNQEADEGGDSIKPLQLGELQVHTFDDKGFSVSYPSDWVEVNTSSESGITIKCETLCLDMPLIMGIVVPGNTGTVDSQLYIEYLISAHTQTVGSPPVSKETITIDGKTAVKTVYEEGDEIIEVDLYLTSNDDNVVYNTMAFCAQGCWEYYKDAVYAITASYQLLD